MKKNLFFLALFITVINFSCKKERSCEGCKENNKPPTAVAGPDQVITLPADSILLDGSASNDPDGMISEWLWTKISGPASFNINNSSASKTAVKNLVGGIYQFELKVTDAEGLFSKDTAQITVTSQPSPPTITCEPTNRPIINAQLIPVGNLSSGRRHMATVSADNKLFFAGGYEISGAASTRVDIYNTINQTWSTAELSAPRTFLSAGAAGDKVFFAGGVAPSGLSSSRVDIYDIATQTWAIAELSQARALIETATVGNKVFFAGGQGSSRVDIYDLSTNTWSVANLSEAKFGFTATVADNKIYFAGGFIGDGQPTSTKIEIYDNATGSWSTSTLNTPRAFHASILNNGKIYWAGGSTESDPNGDCCDLITCDVEIKDINTQVSSFSNLSYPKCVSNAFEKNNKIGFLGHPFGPNLHIGCQYIQHFDVYDLSSNSWSVGIFPQTVSSYASILSVNNTIYIASHDSQVNCDYIFYVWKLEF